MSACTGKRSPRSRRRDALPIGRIKIRRRRRSSGKGFIEVRFIKVSDSGPKGRRWIPLAKYTWEQLHGPVPVGKRVVHVDGNTLNDNPTNYALMTAGEVIRHCHELDPLMSEENRLGQKRRQATAEHNRLRGRIRRATGFLPSRWYLVDIEQCIVVDQPFRSRRKLAAAFGVVIESNGAISAERLANLKPYEFRRGLDVPPGFKRQTEMPE